MAILDRPQRIAAVRCVAVTLAALVGLHTRPSCAQSGGAGGDASGGAELERANGNGGGGAVTAVNGRASGSGAAKSNESLNGIIGLPGPYGETITIDSRGITLQFPDDLATLRVGGRLQLDFGAAGFQPRAVGPAFSDAIAVRRSFIESYLTLQRDTELVLQYDFADPKTPINDAVLNYRDLNPFMFSIGNIKEPFGFEQLMSSNNTLFTERALSNTLTPGYGFGGAIGTNGEQWTAVAGVFGSNANAGIVDNGVAGTVRATYAPILSSEQVLHFGIAGSYRMLERNGAGLSFGSTPEAFLFSKQLVDTKTISEATAVERLGLEGAFQYGSVRVQAEYMLANVDRAASQASVAFQGGYVEASWVLNGKGLPYVVKPAYATTYAVFGGVEVGEGQRVTRGGVGVFELASRFSAVDLADQIVRGGLEEDVSVGLNWYPETNAKIMLDYVHANANPSVQLNGRAVEADTIIGRFQLYW